MKTDHGFLEVSETAYINPETKVAIFAGLFNMETNGTQMFNVYFDRKIDADRLLIPACEAPLYAKPVIPMPEVDPQRLVPFYSPEREKIYEFGFYFGEKEFDQRKLILRMSDFYLDHPEKLKIKFPDVLREKASAEWMLECIMVAFRHYAPEGGLLDGIRRLELWCPYPLFSKLSKRSGSQGSSQKLVRIAEREVVA